MKWPQDEARFKMILAKLAEAFSRPTVTRLTIEAYREPLMFCTIESLEFAGGWIRENRPRDKGFPSPADIRIASEEYVPPPKRDQKFLPEAQPVDPEKARKGLEITQARMRGEITQEELERRMDELYPGTLAEIRRTRI